MICRLALAGSAAGHRRLPGWRAHQRAVRRHGELGTDTGLGYRHCVPHARIQSIVRAQREGGLGQRSTLKNNMKRGQINRHRHSLKESA